LDIGAGDQLVLTRGERGMPIKLGAQLGVLSASYIVYGTQRMAIVKYEASRGNAACVSTGKKKSRSVEKNDALRLFCRPLEV
jgi:hypothetical protein